MQQLDNDMDDLFRRAAEKYPLKSGADHWKDIERKLLAAQASENVKKDNRGNRKFLFPFLLLAGLIAGIVFFTHTFSPGNQQSTNKIITSKTGLSANEKQENSKVTLPLVKDKIHSKRQETEIVKGVAGNLEEKRDLTNASEKNNKTYLTSTGNFSSKFDNDNKYKETNERDNTGAILEKESPKLATGITPKYTTDLASSSLIRRVSRLFKNDNEKNTAKKSIVNKFSISFVASTELNKVSSKPYRAGGYNTGLLGGYNINAAFFVETGILINRKQYLSSGHDFSMRKMGDDMPGGMVINDLKGLSNMLEFPVQVGFRVKRFNQGNIYVSGGMSAYLIMKENNHYNVTMNGFPEKMDGTYKKNIFLLPATLNLSVGGEKQINSTFSLTGEIYFRHPLKGIGIGELPVTSAGVQIGLKKNFR